MDQRHQLLIVATGLALVGLVAVLRIIRAQTRRAARAAYEGVGRVSVFGRGLLTAAVIVGAQWLVITNAADNLTLFWVVLAAPAAVAGFALARVLTVTTDPRRGGGRR
jgi:hypothetical protein